MRRFLFNNHLHLFLLACEIDLIDHQTLTMSASAVEQKDVANLPLQINGKSSSVENVKMEAFEKTDLVLRTFRCLIADLCHQFGCGHPGFVHIEEQQPE